MNLFYHEYGRTFNVLSNFIQYIDDNANFEVNKIMRKNIKLIQSNNLIGEFNKYNFYYELISSVLDVNYNRLFYVFYFDWFPHVRVEYLYYKQLTEDQLNLEILKIKEKSNGYDWINLSQNCFDENDKLISFEKLIDWSN